MTDWQSAWSEALANHRAAILVGVFYLLLATSFVRAGLFATVSATETVGHLFLWGTILGFATLLSLSQSRRRSNFELLFIPAATLGLYVIFNLVLFSIGLRGDYAPYGGIGDGLGQGLMLTWFGLETPRALLPMAAGFNAFGSVAGATFVGGIGLILTRSSKVRVMGGVFAMAGLIALLLTDSRGGLLAALLSAVIVVVTPKSWLSRWRWFVLAAPALPLLLLSGLRLAAQLPGAEAFARESGNLETVSGRTPVWRVTVDHLQFFDPIHLIGYGYEGHQASGISQEYAQYFASYANPTIYGPHNLLLQTVIDTGYLGAVAYLGVMYLTLRRLGKLASFREGSGARASFGILIYLLLLGTIERVPTVYSVELFAVFTFIVVFALFTPFLTNDMLSESRPQDEGSIR